MLLNKTADMADMNAYNHPPRFLQIFGGC